MHESSDHPEITPPDRPILLFDGVCNLCHGSVRFVLRHERQSELRFCALQSEEGTRLLSLHGISKDYLGSLVLVEGRSIFLKSDAALRVTCYLKWPWSWCRAAMILPRGLRDFAYDVIARNRYRWFGRHDACLLPTEELRSRLL
ncbi:MAG: thiol-disulfide oxidoreductase DCC family protein [Luteolibacter sp.]